MPLYLHFSDYQMSGQFVLPLIKPRSHFTDIPSFDFQFNVQMGFVGVGEGGEV